MALKTVVFVHGYSVTDLDTYGELPNRLINEAANYGMQINVEHLFLGRYISFNDEVRLNDVASAMEQAVSDQVKQKLKAGERFVCITHSTGGPVARTWWNNFYKGKTETCPMSHLVMLAPANYGSALAQLGKGRLSRIKSWFNGVEPGQLVLNWLELGSSEAWQLNKDWIFNGGNFIGPDNIFPFSIIGQDIDRKFYDHLNSYTGEPGSDGVVRSAAANQNSQYVKLEQPLPVWDGQKWQQKPLEIKAFKEAPATPFRIVSHKSHSGDTMGIMKSVSRETSDTKSAETVKAIFRCIAVKTVDDYNKLTADFATETAQVQLTDLVEVDQRILGKKYFVHDRYSMVIFRVHDSEGYPVTDFDLILTGKENDPNALPAGFFADRQMNQINKSTVTYFFNYDVMHGRPAMAVNGHKLDALPGMSELGLLIQPRPENGFVRYMNCHIEASKELFELAFKPNSTTMIDICLQRIVSKEVFRYEQLNSPDQAPSGSFKNVQPGNDIVS